MVFNKKHWFISPTIFIAVVGICGVFVLACSAGKVGGIPKTGAKGPVITHYEFALMEVDGKAYKDPYLRVSSDGTISPWPVVSHYIELADIENHIDENTRVLIIGMGARGAVIVPEEIRQRIKAKGITLHCLNTDAAAKLFNRLPKVNLVGLFHLNC